MNQIPEAFKLCSSSCLLSHSVTLPPTLSALGQSVCVCVCLCVCLCVCAYWCPSCWEERAQLCAELLLSTGERLCVFVWFSSFFKVLQCHPFLASRRKPDTASPPKKAGPAIGFDVPIKDTGTQNKEAPLHHRWQIRWQINANECSMWC